MSRRVRSLSAAILALSLILSVPTASAAVMERDRGIHPGFAQRIIKTLKKVLKPLMPAAEEDEHKPLPPIP